MKEKIINTNDAGQRLDKYLFKTFPSLTKGAAYKAIRNKKIKVNRKRAEISQKLEAGDTVLLFLPPDLLEEKEADHLEVSKEPLDIIYEDDEILAVFKPAGLLSQKDSAGQQDTLNGRILNYLISSGQYDPKKESSFVPAAAHRLDRNTSGLVLTAKTAAAARILAEDIRNHNIEKTYQARVQGIPKEGPVHLYMTKDNNLAHVYETPVPDSKPADMDVRLLKQDSTSSWIEIDLHTGRFHQIRACMAYLNHPVQGDVKYGNQKGKLMLQAVKLDLKNSGLKYKGIIELPEKLRIHSA